MRLNPNDGSLYNRPATGEVDLVDTELLLTVLVANAGIDVVVVEKRALLRIPVDTLTTGTVDPAVRLENSSTTALGALLARFVDVTTVNLSGPADLDLVFGARSRTVLVKAAALSNREEKIVVVSALGNVCGLLCVLTIGLEGDVDSRTTSRLEGGVVHVHREQIIPEGSHRHDELGAIPVERAIDGVVVLAGGRGDTGAAVIGPGAHRKGLGSRDTDSGVLYTKG